MSTERDKQVEGVRRMIATQIGVISEAAEPLGVPLSDALLCVLSNEIATLRGMLERATGQSESWD